VNGSGTLATITFKTKAPGVAALKVDLVDTFFLNSYGSTVGETMSFETEDAFVSVMTGANWDLNNDGNVDITDISLAALAFCTSSGHPRWNPAADINGDNKVNIIDLALIAGNFSKSS